MSREPITQRDADLYRMDPISTRFPVWLDADTEWTEYTAYCAGCNAPIEDGHLRGTVTVWPTFACVEAVGACPKCQLLTRFYHRLHVDMRITAPVPGGWGEWRARRSVTDQAMAWVRRIVWRGEKRAKGG